ncbi:MAG: hypothetical protein NTZ51_07530, partial [Proteobacteria bacterium]|nr:hypothetical protein [Pseudomonadota bacterium]
MTARKGKDKEAADWSTGAGGSHNTTAQHRWNGRNLRILQCQTPLHSLCRRLVEAACPVHDTHAAGVVTQANN